MRCLINSYQAVVSVCALVFLFMFHATNFPQRGMAARTPGGAERRQPLLQDRSDVPAGLRAAIEETRYRLEPEGTGEAGYRAPSPAQGWRARFGAEGLNIETQAAGGRAAQSFAMRLKGYGYGERVVPVERAEVVTAGNRVEYRRGSLVEWYVNERRGVEQGFTLREPPAGGADHGEALTMHLAVEGSLRAELSADGESVAFVDEMGGQTLIYDQLVAFDAGARKLPAKMRVERGEVRLEVDDTGAQYPLTIDPFIQQKRLQASNANPNDIFGFSVAISGETAIVGAYVDSNTGARQAGSAYIFTRSGTTWTEQQRLQSFDAATGDNFGFSVAISGNTAIIGASNDSHSGGASAGSAYIFTRNGTTWAQQQQLQAADAGVNDNFGIRVAISGETAIVGAHLDDNSGGANAGSAYVFTRNGMTWTQQQRLRSPDAAPDDSFGGSVAINGETVIVGAHLDDNSGGVNAGSAYVFTRSGATWTQQQRLQSSDAAPADLFGISVAISGETAIVGAHRDGVKAGSAYIFTRSGTTWTEQQTLQASDAGMHDAFGASVAISGETAIVGAYGDDNTGGENAGSAYIFTHKGTTWTEQQRLQASDAATGDNFGWSVAISGEIVIAGAPTDDNSGGVNAGAAYAFFSPTIQPGQIIISEFRTRGPDGVFDDFFELYNTTSFPVTVSVTDDTAGWTFVTTTSSGVVQSSAIIPTGTVIPARGHYLMVGSHYSLGAYPAGNGTTATRDDDTGNIDGSHDGGAALFRTTDSNNFNLANRLDAVGFTTQTNPLYREGAGISRQVTSDVEHSYVRKFLIGTPQDTNDNNADFMIVAPAPASVAGSALGAPGPENRSSPVENNAAIRSGVIDPTQLSFVPPNRVRNGAPDPTEPANSTRGTLKIRRHFINLYDHVTRLRLRVVELTTTPRPDTATAELRVLRNSGGVNITLSDGVTSRRLAVVTREEPPVQTAHGGGFNTTLNVTLASPLAFNDRVYVEFNLGVIEDGKFSFYVNIEALIDPPPDQSATPKAGSRNATGPRKVTGSRKQN